MASELTHKKIDKLAFYLEGQLGPERVKQTRSGYIIRFSDGSTMCLHYTDSDHRAAKNTRARVLRAGIAWPKL